MKIMKSDMIAMLDIEIYGDYGDHTWAQARYLVHGYDDVLWTDDLDAAVNYMRESILQAQKNENSNYRT
jgi:hypothetical protein